MPGSLSLSDWIILGVLALAVAGGLLVAGIRALWTYRAPPWVRRTLLAFGALGPAVAVAGFLTHSDLMAIGGLALGVLPWSGWIVVRSISYTGPPPGLVRGPKVLDSADDVLDSVASLVVGPPDPSDEHDA